MRFFSRLIFIFNLCFVAFVILRYFENQKHVNGDKGHLIPLPFVEGSLVALGWGAIFFNLAFCLIAVPMKMAKKIPSVPTWIVWANFIFLLIELYYHFS